MVSFSQNWHKNQTGQLAGTNESSRLFDIKGGVKQRCALSSRLFCAVLKMAAGMWRGRVGRLGLDTRVLVPNNRQNKGCVQNMGNRHRLGSGGRVTINS